jgi:hypothetical protein
MTCCEDGERTGTLARDAGKPRFAAAASAFDAYQAMDELPSSRL